MEKNSVNFNNENVIFQYKNKDGKKYGLTIEGEILNAKNKKIKDSKITDNVISHFIKSKKIDNDKKYPCMANVEPSAYTLNVENAINKAVKNGELDSEVGISSVHWSALVLVKRTLNDLEKIDRESDKNKNNDIEAE